MSDFERQLRRHYESQKLPEERARAVIEAGRAAAVVRVTRIRWLLAAAAALMIGFGVLSIADFSDSSSPDEAGRILPQDVAAAVVNFFSQPDYQLPQVSADPAELTRWLQARGAPTSLTIPKALASLPSYGCHVLDVRGQRVFLICFFLDVSPGEAAAGGMIKREMVVTAPDGTMMKKNRPLVHLVFAPRDAFRVAPKPGMRVRLPGAGEWNFETWLQDEIVYLAAAAAPAERISAIVQSI